MEATVQANEGRRFSRRRASVRISVSKVAAVSGLHPFMSFDDLSDIIDEAVYQDEIIRVQDGSTLGVGIQTQAQAMDATVRAMAGSSDAAVRAISSSIAGVLVERKSTNEISAVTSLGKQANTLVEQAVLRGALRGAEGKRLANALRSSIQTDFGTRHEDAAIAMYERQTGCAVHSSNEHLLMWRFPEDPSLPPAALRRVPMRPRREFISNASFPSSRRTERCEGTGCGCWRFRALDRCRAALAVERGECAWWFRKLRALDSRASPLDYSQLEGASEPREGRPVSWDALGLMSDLRVTRGRILFSELREERRRRQRLDALLRVERLRRLCGTPLGHAVGDVDGCDEPEQQQLLQYERGGAGAANVGAVKATATTGTFDSIHVRSTPASGTRVAEGESLRLDDYCHGGDRWDVDALREALAAERAWRRSATTELQQLRATAAAQDEDANGMAAVVGRAGEEVAEADQTHDEDEDHSAYFYLCGAVDGVTDELVPPPAASSHGAVGDKDEGWFVQRVVVEVKNRVSSIKVPPPFYDELQLGESCRARAPPLARPVARPSPVIDSLLQTAPTPYAIPCVRKLTLADRVGVLLASPSDPPLLAHEQSPTA